MTLGQLSMVVSDLLTSGHQCFVTLFNRCHLHFTMSAIHVENSYERYALDLCNTADWHLICLPI
jgi:hypothetical protein